MFSFVLLLSIPLVNAQISAVSAALINRFFDETQCDTGDCGRFNANDACDKFDKPGFEHKCNGAGETNYLYVANKKMDGPLPAVELGQLTALMRLDLTSNDNLDGTIPTEIGSLKLLTFLALNHNAHDGSIPSEVNRLFWFVHLTTTFF